MISCDTNILFAACDLDSGFHDTARGFLQEHSESDDFCLCEQVLMELYCLLRNPTVSSPPLSAGDAVACVQAFRANRCWRIVDLVPGHGIMERVWTQAGRARFPYRRVFDARLGAVLRHHGVAEFATRNVRDFRDCGFSKVWDPLLG